MRKIDSTAGITAGGLDELAPGKAYTFVTNHRDIVLDASFLNLCFLRAGLPTSEVAIGDNLLIYDTGSLILREAQQEFHRAPRAQAYQGLRGVEASVRLYPSCHYREASERVDRTTRGPRAKDSNDFTQEAVVKMLGIVAGGKSLAGNIEELQTLCLLPSHMSTTPTIISRPVSFAPQDRPRLQKEPAR